jgi:hypothetical protein
MLNRTGAAREGGPVSSWPGGAQQPSDRMGPRPTGGPVAAPVDRLRQMRIAGDLLTPGEMRCPSPGTFLVRGIYAQDRGSAKEETYGSMSGETKRCPVRSCFWPPKPSRWMPALVHPRRSRPSRQAPLPTGTRNGGCQMFGILKWWNAGKPLGCAHDSIIPIPSSVLRVPLVSRRPLR